MTAQYAKDQVSFMTAVTLSAASPAVFAPTDETTVGTRLGAAVKWFSNLLQRRAVLDELGSLSDHELTDIGLTRSDIPRVFDRAFVAQRSTPRAAR